MLGKLNQPIVEIFFYWFGGHPSHLIFVTFLRVLSKFLQTRMGIGT